MDNPVLVYDDDCDFCTRSARLVAREGTVTIVGFSELSAEHRERLPENFRDCAHLLTEDGVYSCGEAVERSFERAGLVPGFLLATLRSIPGYATARERGYRFVAKNRGTFGRFYS